MTPSTYPTRLIRMLVLGAIVAGTVTSVAAAIPIVDNDVAATQAGFPTAEGLKADGLRLQGMAQVYKQIQPATGFPTAQGLRADGLRLQGMAQVYKQVQPAPDVFERYAAGHPYGVQLSSVTGSRVASPANAPVPDVLERYATAHPYGVGVSSASGSGNESSRFSWGDYGIGIGSGIGLIVLLAGGLAMAWQRRHRVQTA
jgi:hypothetical protein